MSTNYYTEWYNGNWLRTIDWAVTVQGAPLDKKQQLWLYDKLFPLKEKKIKTKRKKLNHEL